MLKYDIMSVSEESMPACSTNGECWSWISDSWYKYFTKG